MKWEQNVKICCLQETKIPVGFPEEILSFGGYNLELEISNSKKRVGTYLKSDVNYIRRNNLEIKNSHIVIVDVFFNVINFWWSFLHISLFDMNTQELQSITS